MPQYPGAFFTFEGIDGCGKTTQLRMLAARLEGVGHRVVRTQEPGGTRVGLQIREILLDSGSRDLRAVPELLLYFASRAQNVEEVILPALREGSIVLADRFTDASTAYQGYGRGLGAETVVALDRIACGGLRPDLTFLIDVDIETSMARSGGRTADRMEQESLEFRRRVRQGYLEIGRQDPARVQVIDGRRSAEHVAAEIGVGAERFLAARNVTHL